MIAEILGETGIYLVHQRAWNNNRFNRGYNMPVQSKEVELIRVPGGINAKSILAALHGRGIPAHSHGEIVGEIYGLTYDGLGEVSIRVPEEYLEEAKSILSAGEQGELMFSEDDSVDKTD